MQAKMSIETFPTNQKNSPVVQSREPQRGCNLARLASNLSRHNLLQSL